MDNQTKIITISKIETKVFTTGTQYRITDTTNKIYKFYDKKKDNSNTVAFSQFQDMELKPNSTVEIWFKEEEKEYQGKAYTDRLIASFREAKNVPQKEPVYEEIKNGEFWDKKAYKQCLWNYWLEHNAPDNASNWKDLVWDIFNQIDKDADKRFANGWDKAVKTFGADDEENSYGGQPVEVDGSGIPF